VRPEKPGGMEVPDRDKLIYTQKRAGVEHLLPPPEKPMPRPTAPSAAGPSASPQPAPAPVGAGTANSATQAQPQQPAGKPPAKAEVAAAKPATAQKTGGTRLQLASVRSEGDARQEWDRLKRANADLLGSLSATPVRADLGEKGVYYRLQTAPIADAERVCGELKRRNIGCIIAR
jgi:hypothetical protein